MDLRDPSTLSVNALLRHRAVEAFLIQEAELLDEWRLRDWLELYAQDARYLVPAIGKPGMMEADPATTLFLIADDRLRIEQRVVRLEKKSAFAEYPHSKTRHVISNISIKSDEDDLLICESNVVVYRTRESITQVFPGRQKHVISSRDNRFIIKEKRIVLDLDSLATQGKLSIIL